MKTIYEAKGKAGEYAKYAVNFYNGCSNGCVYCFNKRGVLKHALGGDRPVLQKRYTSEAYALSEFKHDVRYNYEQLQEDGLFFTFSSDPCLEDTWRLNADAICFAIQHNIPCTVLTKCAGQAVIMAEYIDKNAIGAKSLLAIGFTLTGHNELEPNASINNDRIEAMRVLHKAGFMTWASIEPIIDPVTSLAVMKQCDDYCDHFKVGLRSGVAKTYYNDDELRAIFEEMGRCLYTPIYLKDSFVNRLGLQRDRLGHPFVGANFNLFGEGNV